MKDKDLDALKKARKALLQSTSEKMLKANLKYLVDYFLIHPPDNLSEYLSSNNTKHETASMGEIEG